MTLNFKGAALRLGDVDIPRIGSKIGVGEDELHAFIDVEAAGSGFDHMGRPKMLFEPHVFYGMLGKGAKRDAAVKAGLAYPKWGEKPYPSDSYPRLIKAMAIDDTAALKSASWGLTQILGRYHADIGYATPQEMVEEFANHEAEHLEATVKLLKAWKVDDDLRAHRWAVVAQTWNGPGYRKNRYDTKLEAAFAKWQKIKDTPWSPSTPAPQPAPPVIDPKPSIPAASEPVPAPADTTPAPPPVPTSAPGKKTAAAASIVVLLGAAIAGFWHHLTDLFWSIF